MRGMAGFVTGRGEGVGTASFLLSLLLVSAMLDRVGSEQLCEGSRTQHCNSCPNQCLSPDKCIVQSENLNRCRGSSWGNTNSTFMGVECRPPQGIEDVFPRPSIISPVLSAPLACNGTILRGSWPFDADNMSFAINTFFRDPKDPDQQINTEFLRCLTLTLKVESAIYTGQSAGTETLACKLTEEELETSAYSGLEASVCVETDLSKDPMCRKGIWKPITSGVCRSEKVAGQIALPDTGDRTLVRVGGANQLTGCQPKWTLNIERDAGVCGGEMRGSGSCCRTTCFNSQPLSNVSCVCKCKPGFVGAECDKTAPHLAVSLLVFNKTVVDWFASKSSEIGLNQPFNQFLLQRSVAQVLGISTSYVEFASAEPSTNDGTGLGGQLGLYADVPATRRRRSRELLQVRPGCTRLLESDTSGAGLSRVNIRILTVFEHDLRLLSNSLEVALRNGTLESSLAEKGLLLCILDQETRFYNAFGFELLSRLPKTPADTLGTEQILLIVFFLLAGLVALVFFCLQVVSNRLHEQEILRHQREHKPVSRLQRRPVAWRFINPANENEVGYPANVSSVLEKAYVDGWLKNKKHKARIFFKDHWWDVNFSCMTATQEGQASSGRIKKVMTPTSFELDGSASNVMGYYNGKLFSIQFNADGTPVDAQVSDQKQLVQSYISTTKEITLELPIMPTPVPGSYWRVEAGAGTDVVKLLPPGIDRNWFSEFWAGDAPDEQEFKAYKEFLKKSHSVATNRFEAEIHYPIEKPMPANTEQNIFRIAEIREEQLQQKKESMAKRRHQASGFGQLGSSGKITFTGKDLREWQLAKYENFVGVEALQQSLHPGEEHQGQLATIDDGYGAEDYGALADEVFKREVFHPGAYNEILADIGVVVPGVDRAPTETQDKLSLQKRAASIKLGHVDSVKEKEETRIDIKTPTRVRARPRKVTTKQKAREDEYLEEVAV